MGLKWLLFPATLIIPFSACGTKLNKGPVHTGPKLLEGSIYAISTIESMKVGTYHFIQDPHSSLPSHLRGRSVQSQPLRAWKLGLTTSHRVPSPQSQVTWGVDPCNLNRWEHGIWDLPRHTWSQVTWGHSEPLRGWKLGLTPSHKIPNP